MNLPTLASILLLLIPSACQSWSQVADKVKASTVTVEFAHEDATATCSGFFIDSKRHYILTDAHCDGADLRVEGSAATRIYKDDDRDLMVLSDYFIFGPALRLAPKPPVVGEEVGSLGTGLGLSQPMFRIAHVATVGLQVTVYPGIYVALDKAFIHGQSGGPVVNRRGEVIGIVNSTQEDVGYALDAEVIRQRVGRYFED